MNSSYGVLYLIFAGGLATRYNGKNKTHGTEISERGLPPTIDTTEKIYNFMRDTPEYSNNPIEEGIVNPYRVMIIVKDERQVSIAKELCEKNNIPMPRYYVFEEKPTKLEELLKITSENFNSIIMAFNGDTYYTEEAIRIATETMTEYYENEVASVMFMLKGEKMKKEPKINVDNNKRLISIEKNFEYTYWSPVIFGFNRKNIKNYLEQLKKEELHNSLKQLCNDINKIYSCYVEKIDCVYKEKNSESCEERLELNEIVKTVKVL